MFSLEHSLRSLIALAATMCVVSHSVAGIAAGPLAGQPDALTRSREAELKRILFAMREAIDQYYVDNGRYPRNLKTLEAEGYLPKIATDPLTQRDDSWRTIRSKPTARGQRQPTGIYDVKSGSKRTASDGTRYSDW
jgi:general secretion pathway protein G